MLAIVFGAASYISIRLNQSFNLSQFRILQISISVGVIASMFGMMALSNTISTFGNVLYMLTAVTIGLFLYTLLSVLLIDAIGLLVKITPFTKGIISLSLAVTVSAFGIINASRIQTIKHEVKLEKLQNPLKIMHLTDIHLGHFRGVKWAKQIVAKTNAQQPDLIVITGDLFDGKIRINESTLEPFLQLKAPIYFVEGNHDDYSGVQRIKQMLIKLGVHVLENEMIETKGLQIIGLDHMVADHKTFDMHADGNGPTIQSVLKDLTLDKNKPSLLLHHSPNGASYAAQAGISLFLAGHTHAGQMWPATYVANWMFPFNKGMHDIDGTKIYVSHGAGTFGPPMRIGTRSEITLFNLVGN